MEQKEPTELEKEAEEYFDRNIMYQHEEGKAPVEMKFVGISSETENIAVLQLKISKVIVTKPLEGIVQFFRNQKAQVQAAKDRSNKLGNW